MIDIAVDVRCLQDPASIVRGIGQHSHWIMREARRHLPEGTRLVAVEDTAYPPLAPSEKALFDIIASTPSVFDRQPPAAFLQPAPNGVYPQARFARILGSEQVLKCAIIYDFIPWDQPQIFLQHATARLLMLNQMTWTRGYDRYFPISEHSAARLRDLLAVAPSQIVVTGACLRPSFKPARDGKGLALPELPYFLCVFSISPHKNPDAPVIAHARMAAQGVKSVLVIAGGDPANERERLARLYRDEGGPEGGLVFHIGPSDEDLARLYAGAVTLVAPSYDEGFCLPIVEALSQGCPVLASKRGSQPELVPQSECHFEPDDHARLESLMSSFLKDAARREDLLKKQQGIVTQFTAEKVGGRLWTAIAREMEGRKSHAPSICRKKKPVVAVVASNPSGVAGSEICPESIEALGRLVDVEVHANRKLCSAAPGKAKLNSISVRPYLSARLDGVLSFIDDSEDSGIISDYVRWHGGACILHDATFLKAGSRVPSQDDPEDLLGRIVPHAMPIMVHSLPLEQRLERSSELRAKRLPQCFYRRFTADEVSTEGRASARRELGWGEKDFHLLTTSAVLENALYSLGCLEALHMLTESGSRVCLHFVGKASGDASIWRDLISELGLASVVDLRCILAGDDDNSRRAVLAASSAVFAGQNDFPPPTILADCLSAGLPVFTSGPMAEVLDLPNHTKTLPDNIFAVSLADAIAAAASSDLRMDLRLERRERFRREASYETYARLIVEHLGIELPSA